MDPVGTARAIYKPLHRDLHCLKHQPFFHLCTLKVKKGLTSYLNTANQLKDN